MKNITILALHLNYGGIEKCITNLANSLCDDYNVTIVSTYKIVESPAFLLDERVQVQYLLDRLKPNQSEFRQAKKDRKYVKLLKEGFCSFMVLYYRKRKMISYIKSCKSDVIISTRDIHNYWLGTYGNKKSIKIGWEHNHPDSKIVDFHNVVSSAENLDYLVLVSPSICNEYKEALSESTTKCIYIPNAIDYLPNAPSNLDNYNIISAGRLSKEKGYFDLIDVFKLVYEKNSKATLTIVGDGLERLVLQEYIETNDLQDTVTLTGFKSPEEIHELFSKSSVFAMSSYSESFGIVVVEAFSFGLPCVAFDSAQGIRELIEDGKDGYLISHRNKQEMADRILALLQEIGLRSCLGKAGFEKAKEYSINNLKEQWIKLIEK